MREHMAHQEYVVSCRNRAVEVANGMLSGAVPVLEGCNQLAALRAGVEVGERDPDFETFSLISSEIEALPVGDVRAHWASDALARLEPEMQSATEWATPLALPACQSLVSRFAA